MTTYFTQFLSHPQYSDCYKSLLYQLGRVDNNYLFSELKDDLFNSKFGYTDFSDSLFNKFNDNEKILFLNKLRPITRTRRMFSYNYKLSDQEVLYLLQNARSKSEVISILQKYPIPFAFRDILLASNRAITRFAAEEAIRYNISKSVEWALFAAQIVLDWSSYRKNTYHDEISNLLIEHNDYAQYFKLHSGKEISLLCFSISLLTADELTVLNSAKFKVLDIKVSSEKTRNEMLFIYLCLLKYYSEKNNIKFKFIDKMQRFYTKYHKKGLAGYYFDGYNAGFDDLVKLTTSEYLGLYANKLSKADYHFILSNLGVTAELTNRSDFDFEVSFEWVKNNLIFREQNKPQQFRFSELIYDNFDIASKFIRNEEARKEFYKLIPYFILRQTHQYLLFAHGQGIKYIIKKGEVDTIQRLFDEITELNYPVYSQSELTIIKKRISYTFTNNFNFEKGIFSEYPKKAEMQIKPHILLAYCNSKYWYNESGGSPYFNYHDVLSAAKSREDIEKIIMVAGNISYGAYANFNFLKKDSQNLAKLVFDIIKPYSVEKAMLAIVLAKDWHGSKDEFITMMELI
jgi:hypothetical protein